MIGRCTAAATGNRNTFCEHRGDIFRKFVGKDIEDRFAVHDLRQTCIRLDKYGNRCGGEISIHDRRKCFRTERAVDTDGIRAHTLEHRDHCLGRCTRHQLAVRAIGIGYKHRQIARFLCGKQSGFRFVAVVHRLNEDKINAVFCTDANHLGEALHRVLKVKITKRREHLSARTDVKCNEFFVRGIRRTPSRTRTVNGGMYDLGQCFGIKFQRVCAEGIGVDDIASAVIVCFLDGNDLLGMGEIPKLGQLTRFQSLCLQKCTHTAVKDQRLLLDVFKNSHDFAPLPMIAERLS